MKRKGRPEEAKRSAYDIREEQLGPEAAVSKAGVMLHFGIGSADVMRKPALYFLAAISFLLCPSPHAGTSSLILFTMSKGQRT